MVAEAAGSASTCGLQVGRAKVTENSIVGESQALRQRLALANRERLANWSLVQLLSYY